jgi:hypothetical protein
MGGACSSCGIVILFKFLVEKPEDKVFYRRKQQVNVRIYLDNIVRLGVD